MSKALFQFGCQTCVTGSRAQDDTAGTSPTLPKCTTSTPINTA